jgi:hypothetical protein
MPLSPSEVKTRIASMQGRAFTMHCADIDEMLLKGRRCYRTSGMDATVKLRIIETYNKLGWGVVSSLFYIEFFERTAQ